MLRSLSRLLGLSLALTVAAPVFALPLKAKNLASVRLRVNGEGKPGYQLRPESNGWRMKLELDAAQPLVRVDVIDVTPGTPARTMSLRAELGQVLFDGNRFEAGHVYRISVSAATGQSLSTFVYLQPSPVLQTSPKGPGKVDFAEGEKALAEESDLLPVSKGSL